MTSPHKLCLAVALLSLAGGTGCAADEETEAGGTAQDVVGTFKDYASDKAVDRLEDYLSQSLYQGTTPDGDDCTMTVSRNNETHLVAVSIGLFRTSGLERTGFVVNADAKVSNWTDRTIALDFDLHFTDDDDKAADAHVAIGAPKRVTSSVKVQFADRAYECASLKVTRAPMR